MLILVFHSKAAEMKKEQKAIIGVLTRLIKRKLSMGFEKWQAEAADDDSSLDLEANSNKAGLDL